MKSKRFAFTFLRPTEQTFLDLYEIRAKLTYLVCAIEKAPVSKIVHLQGYLELDQEVEQFVLKSKLPKFYIEIARENRDVNKSYCLKDTHAFLLFDRKENIFKCNLPLCFCVWKGDKGGW